MANIKSMEEIYEDEIQWLTEQRDYTRQLLHQHLQYHSADVDRLNEEIGDYTYRIGKYKQLLEKLQEEKVQNEQDQH